MKIKLSPAQLHVLFELKEGVILYLTGGINSSWFLSEGEGYINSRTIWKLERLGFIKRTDEFHQKGILTDKGRTYLKEIGESHV